MKKLRDILETTFAATAFAEADDDVTALEMTGKSPAGRTATAGLFRRISDAFAAVAFAEADEADMAREIMGRPPIKKSRSSLPGFLESVGLGGVKVYYGVVNA